MHFGPLLLLDCYFLFYFIYVNITDNPNPKQISGNLVYVTRLTGDL